MHLIVGEALIDLILDFTLTGTSYRSIAIKPATGGSSFNVAIGMSRLDKRVALMAPISNDALGRHIEQQLLDEGVDVTYLNRTDAPTPLAMISIDGLGVPQYAFYGLQELQVRLHAATPEAQRITAIHLSSVSLVSSSANALLDDIANASDTLVSLDPNVRLAVEPDRSIWRKQIALFRRHADIVKVSNEDLEAAFSSGCDADEIAAGWLGERTKLVVLTKGNSGCRVFYGDGYDLSIPAGQVTVVDTVGAGDTFMAAMLCWLDENGIADRDSLSRIAAADVVSMARFATEAAAVTCSRAGPNMARRSELPLRSGKSSGG